MRAFAIVFSGLLLAAPAVAQPTGNAAGSGESPDTNIVATEEPEEDPDRRICRRIETNTGSRVPHRRVCMTAAQWRAYDRRR